MASDKKPSMYSGYPDRGKIGSAEELEAYGVWVKSEPQDFTASLAEAGNFNADALPYEADFDTGFDNMGMGSGGFDLLESDLHIPEMSVEDDELADGDRGGEEASSQTLMKIAHELSAIRAELNTLKKEFAEIRAESGGEGGDEKIALSGEEMENFFNAADFPTEEEMGFDPGREADEAALKELDAQNEAEDIPIDFDNLGIALDGAEAPPAAETEAEAPQEELPPLESVVDNDDFEMPSFDALSFDEAPDEAPPSELDELEASAEGFAEELVPLEGEDEELQALRLEGAESLASPPENADYLEEDPFALNNADLEGTAALEPAELEPAALEPAELDETALSEEIAPEPEESAPEEPVLEEAAPEEPALEEPVLEEAAPEEPEPKEPELEELTFEDIEVALPEEETAEAEVAEAPAAEPAVAEAAPAESADIGDELSFDESSFDLELDDFSTEPSPAEEAAGEEAAAEEEKAADEPVFDTSSLELPEEATEELEIGTEETEEEEALDSGADEPLPDIESLDLSDAVIDEPNLSEEIVEASVEEPVLGDISFGDEISLDMDGFETELEAKAEEPAEAAEPAESAEPAEPAEDLEVEEKTDDLIGDLALELDARTEDEELGADNFELEPTLEPAVETVEAVETKDAVKPAAPANDIISDIDDSIIPEGFEVNAKEADPSVDDDLEAFADGELAITEDESPSDSADKLADDSGEFSAIPPGLKNELKNVLSYMDHLLESLPEDKIEEFAQSEYFDKYKKIFKELGLV